MPRVNQDQKSCRTFTNLINDLPPLSKKGHHPFTAKEARAFKSIMRKMDSITRKLLPRLTSPNDDLIALRFQFVYSAIELMREIQRGRKKK